MSTSITTEILGELPKLSEVKAPFPISTSWIRGGDGLVGFGKYKSHRLVWFAFFTFRKKYTARTVSFRHVLARS